MKEATGELNMTVVVVIAIAAVAALFYAFVWPAIRSGLMLNTCKDVCPGGSATSFSSNSGGGGTCTCGDSTSISIAGS